MCVCVILCVLNRNYWQAFLDKTRQKVTLSEKIQLSHDTYIYRFALPKKNMMLGLPVGKHFKVRTSHSTLPPQPQPQPQPQPTPQPAPCLRQAAGACSLSGLGPRHEG